MILLVEECLRLDLLLQGPERQENLVTWARPILRDKNRLEELADPRLEGKYPKEDFVRVCKIPEDCVAPEASQRPITGEVVQLLKMVQRVIEYQHTTTINSGARPNLRQSATTFESDVNKHVEAHGIPDFPMPANVPGFHRQHRKHSPHGVPWLRLAPSQPHDYGPIVTTAHAPSSSSLSKPSMKKNGLVPPSAGLAPPQFSPSTLPSCLAQPPFSPHTSTDCFGQDVVLKRRTIEASPNLPSAPAVTVSSHKGRHPSSILIVGIVAGILIITMISTLFICLCGSNHEQKKGSHKEAEKPKCVETVPAQGSFPHPTSTRFLPYEQLKEATNNFALASILDMEALAEFSLQS
uniref:Uncharacterized protein n=1 Tax=Solanum lycopersicum TaxID=4081 RepID=K4AVW9_SOLLC